MSHRTPPTCSPESDTIAQQCDITTVTFSRPVNAWCHYCGYQATTRDHIVPDSIGGARDWWNLVPSCAACNTAKADRQACACMFCVRAIALWHLGYRRTGKSRADMRRVKKQRKLEKIGTD